MASRGWLFRMAPGLLALMLASPSLADDATATQREADDRFQEGKALLAQSQIAAACQKFEQSLALLRRGGTLLNLAVCREKEGRAATAMRLFQEALTASITDKRPDREQLARERLADVRTRVSWISIKPPAGVPVPGLTIRCDDQPVPAESWGSPLAFDAGAHRIAANAPGRVPIEISVTLATPGETRTVELPALAPIAPEPTATATTTTAATVTAQTTTLPQLTTSASNTATPPPAADGPSWKLPVGIAAMLAGVGGLAVGGAFGVEAISANNATRTLCPNNHCTSPDGVQKNKDAKSAALVADIAFPAGLVAVSAGLFVLVTSGSRPPSPPSRVTVIPGVGPEGGSLSVRGAW